MTKEYKMPAKLKEIFDKWIKESCRKGKKAYSIYIKFNHGEYTVEYEDLEPFMQFAFEAGYKAGKDMNVSIKWHDLRKDPNDLPYVSGFYLVSKSCWDGCYTHVHYFNKGCNESGHWDVNVDTLNFIAWCELPKYGGKL